MFAGESWISYSRHIKGFDSFFTAKYEEGIQWIKKSIEKAGYEFCYISNTYAAEKFPRTLEELKDSMYALQWFYDVDIKHCKSDSEIPSNLKTLVDKIRKVYQC